MNSSASSPAAAGRSSGFTLVEMLVVIAILGIMLLIGNQTMEWLLPETALSGTARNLASTIEDARSEAVLKGRPVRIEYQLGDNENDPQSYRAIFEPGPGEERAFEEIEVELDLTGWIRLPRGLRISGLYIGEEDFIGTGYFSFLIHADGSMSSHVVQIFSRELDSTVSLEVSSLLDDVHVHDGPLEPFYLREEAF